MSQKRKPQPERFDVFHELKDGSGFTIPGCDFIFKFDRFGGWFDEYGNYYDENGDPTDEPEDSEHSYSHSNHSDDEDDPYEKQFGRPKDYDDDHEPHHLKGYEAMANNLQKLSNYPYNEPLRVHFSNVPYTVKKDQLLNYFESKVADIVDLFYFNNQRNQFNGTGYFLVKDAKVAQELLKFQYQNIFGRNIRFELVDVQEFLQDPLTPNELKNIPKKEGIKKKYERKNETVKEEKSKIENVKKEQKVEKVEKKVQVKLDPEEFVHYIFEKKSFPKKSSFREWLEKNGFNVQNDMKEVSKIEGKEDFAKVQMKRKIYNKLNGTEYNGKKIEFTLE